MANHPSPAWTATGRTGYSSLALGYARNLSPTLFTAAVVVAPALLGVLVVLLKPSIVAVVGLALATVAGCYLLMTPFYTRAFHLIILTLPFTAAFVIDIGGNLRVPYYFAVLAFVFGLSQGRLCVPKMTWPIILPGVFALYAFLSTGFALRYDTAGELIPYGFRNSLYRPLIQAGQLGLMLIFFYLTVNYITSKERLHSVARLLAVSLTVVVLYATYEVTSAVFHFPFFNINTNPDYVENRFAGTQLIAAGSIYIPRPRSILVEPSELGRYILLCLPCMIAMLGITRTKVARRVLLGVISLTMIVFVLTWSRAAFLGAVVVLPLTFLLVHDRATRWKLALGGVAAYLAIATIIFPLLGTDVSVGLPGALLYERLGTLSSLPTDLRAVEFAGGPNGRLYGLALEVFKMYPITGVGLGNYFFALAELRGGPIQGAAIGSHFLEVLTQLGIIGTSLYLLFIGVLLWRLIKVVFHPTDPSLRNFALASLVSIIAVMVSLMGAGGGLTTSSHVWVMLAIGTVIPSLNGRMAVSHAATNTFTGPAQTG